MRITRRAAASLIPLTFAACSSSSEPTPRLEAVAKVASPIVGGIPDLFRSYVVGVGDVNGAFCTGTLISGHTVLTAAHCYTPGKSKGGITHVFFGPKLNDKNYVHTIRVVRHPDYKSSAASNDLCLVEIEENIPTQPAPLLREAMNNGPNFIGPRFNFVGYGDNGANHYDIRRVAVFPIAAVGPSSIGSATGTGPIDITMFYYNFPQKNTCDGDSGGPGFAVRGGVERVAGVTSFGDTQCVIDGVNARSDAAQIAAFIQPTIDQFESMDPCRADGVCAESCNTKGTLVDPDCAPNHCGADGMCVLSCVLPVDPDCTGIDYCGDDGACDPTCAIPDTDCAPQGGTGGMGTGGMGTGGMGTGGMGTGGMGTGGTGGMATSESTSSSGSSTAGSSTSSTGSSSSSGATDLTPDYDAGGGCSCRVAGFGKEAPGPAVLGLLAAASAIAARRRRQPG